MALSELHFCGWRPVVSRTLLGGIVLCTTLAAAYADDKGHKGKGSAAPVVPERVARVERQPAKPTMTQPTTTQSSPTRSQPPMLSTPAHKFQPQFNRGPQRVNLPPASQANSIAFLQKETTDKKKESGKPPKPPKVEQPKPVKPMPEKPVHQKPVVEKPVVVKPMPVTPMPEKPITVKPKVEMPKNPNGNQNPSPKADRNPNRGAGKGEVKIDEPIRVKKPVEKPLVEGLPGVNPPNTKVHIKKPDEAGKPMLDVSNDSKVKLRTPRPDIKVANPGHKEEGSGAGVKLDRDLNKNGDKPPRIKDGGTLTRDQHEKIKLDLDKSHRDLVSKGKVALPQNIKVKLPNEVKLAGRERLQTLPREALKVPVPKNGKLDPVVASKLKLRPANEVLNARMKNGDFQHLANMKYGKTYQLNKQFQFHQHGDIGRRMNLLAGLHARGGWRHRFFGPISPIYSSHCMPMWYAGPSFCSPYIWYPTWSPWVDWCWWDTCAPIYDPRPIICHPIVYDPCSPWVYWNLPTWTPLPYVTCGTWVDVQPVVISSGMDVQLLATRFVDPGHPGQELGPRFRVWVRNNTPVDINQPFNVMLIASNDANAFAGLPEAGIRVQGMRAGETQAVRLPYAANTMGRDSANRPIPFTYVTALVDSHNELPEAFENNNGASLIRGDILPVDPAAFAAEPGSAQPNGVIHVAGEGLGPEPGQALVVIGDQEFQAEILGWFDLGVQVRMPDFDLDAATAADLIIVRGDGAASNPLTIEIDPAPMATAEAVVPEAPAPELPAPPPLPEPVS